MVFFWSVNLKGGRGREFIPSSEVMSTSIMESMDPNRFLPIPIMGENILWKP